jgi:hypothetical protein
MSELAISRVTNKFGMRFLEEASVRGLERGLESSWQRLFCDSKLGNNNVLNNAKRF